VLSGKSDAVILEEFNEYKKENIESEIQTIKEVIKVDEFWKYDFKGDVLIIPLPIQVIPRESTVL
jgi:hypothetical protein